ncbi:MAG: hypothetical protein FRX49_10575 [Trebouxia sp. A1-2]|nr:MAG: hypothetical protein FRX49_10575 [Trebouxia sp. A1-2]
MQGSLTSSTFELRASNTKLQTQLNALQLQLAETEAQLQQEQIQREVTGERSLEQAKRAAAVNVEIVKANNILKQQLRVKAEEDRLLIARLQAQLNDFHASQQAHSISLQEPAALSLSAWQANEYLTGSQHESMSQSVATFIADRTQLETVSPHTSPPKLNSRAAQKAEHIPACHQLHSDGHGNASRSEATGSTTQLSTASGSTTHGSQQEGVLPRTDRAGDAITGSRSRCTTAMQPSETEHSRGLQQIWNSMARTPLAVPSPRAVASSLSQASVASSAADLPDQQSGCGAEPFSDPTGRGVGPSVSSSTSTGAAAETDTAASEQHQVPSENDTDGTDADTPVRYEQRRSGRTKPRVVYQEPKLRTKLRQGDAFTFGIAESTPRSAMRRKRVMPRQKANLESPNKTCAAVSVLKQQPRGLVLVEGLYSAERTAAAATAEAAVADLLDAAAACLGTNLGLIGAPAITRLPCSAGWRMGLLLRLTAEASGLCLGIGSRTGAAGLMASMQMVIRPSLLRVGMGCAEPVQRSCKARMEQQGAAAGLGVLPLGPVQAHVVWPLHDEQPSASSAGYQALLDPWLARFR